MLKNIPSIQNNLKIYQILQKMSRKNELQKFVAGKLDHQFQHGLEMRRSVMHVNDKSKNICGQLRRENKVCYSNYFIFPIFSNFQIIYS